ncbi:MAG: hypothetical protein D6788_03745 [Planctomycetota bacterium]|nr:MAG: hypothetical protein D6788_03745 [Planctomycetota bacterium]
MFLRDSGATLTTTTGSVLTIGAGQTVHGRGGITGAFVNEGTIRNDSTSLLTLTPQEAGIANRGRIEVQGGGIVINNAALFDNGGDVVVNDGRSLTANGGYNQSDGTTTVNGTLTVNAAPAVFQGGTLGGVGTVRGDVRSTAAVVAPGNSVGTLTVVGDYEQQSGAVLRIELRDPALGTPSSDHLTVSGAVILGGTLDVVRLGGYTPPPGTSVEIISAASVTGRFDTVLGAGPLDVIYTADRVLLYARCAAGDGDCNGTVDLVDHAAFADCMAGPGALPHPTRPGLTAEQCLAGFDLDGDGDVDLDDFAPFARAFAVSNP